MIDAFELQRNLTKGGKSIKCMKGYTFPETFSFLKIGAWETWPLSFWGCFRCFQGRLLLVLGRVVFWLHVHLLGKMRRLMTIFSYFFQWLVIIQHPGLQA